MSIKDIFGDKTDLSEYEDMTTGFALIPDGIHEFEIEKLELRKASTGGQYIYSMFRLHEGKQCLFNNFNVVHSKEEVAERAKNEFAAMLKAAGFLEVPDELDETIGAILKIQVGHKPTKDSLAARRRDPMAELTNENTIKKYVVAKTDSSPQESSAEVNLPEFNG